MTIGEPAMALATLVCFKALLRPSEAVALTRDRVCDDGDEVVLILSGNNARTKTSDRRVPGLVESARIKCPRLVALLREYRDSKRSKLFDFSTAEWREKFKFVNGHNGHNHLGLNLHSLRRGGATALFSRCGDIAKVMAAGRWRSLATCKLYVEEARALVASIAMTGEEEESVMRTAEHV